MEKIMNYASSFNYDEFMRQLNILNPLSKHGKEEVEKEVGFTKAAMADVKNQVAEYNLGPNPERTAIFNKIETIFGQMAVHTRPPTYWNRTKEEALSYHLHNSHATAETLRNLVRDLWKTVKDDKVDKDLQEYRQKKLQYLTKREGDVNIEERKKFDTVDDLSGRVKGIGIDKKDPVRDQNIQSQDFGRKFDDTRKQDPLRDQNIQSQDFSEKKFVDTRTPGTYKDQNIQSQDFSGKKFDEQRTQVPQKDFRSEERNYEGGRTQGTADRIGGNYLGSEFSAGDDKKDHGDYQFHKMKQNEGLQKGGYSHPPTDREDSGYQRDYGYYNNTSDYNYYPKQQPGYYNPTDSKLPPNYQQRSPDNLQRGV
jgi:hypothetical protein